MEATKELFKRHKKEILFTCDHCESAVRQNPYRGADITQLFQSSFFGLGRSILLCETCYSHLPSREKKEK